MPFLELPVKARIQPSPYHKASITRNSSRLHARQISNLQRKDGTRTIKCDEFLRLLIYSQTQEASLSACVPNIKRIYCTNKDYPRQCQLSVEAVIVKREMLREICTLERRSLRKASFGLEGVYESDSVMDYHGFNRPRPTLNVESETSIDKASS
ncbi:hypothetical protein MGYG_03390 [Nannizzia gypsea CBS 118893]|uniref:Uncharacterized protein n=1 Tax=Arthroderma gypseum (strain ATCC MYA-4604 / CBS 118893) TaxID=535722 RepID=E4UND6_ARTGP|nr:hypothetical protein MGYG_03390 [Nannizzia gypsea CBS 118893]EFR00386.1 hypothetical protein MGYG_03390 [Nannizzia gypsea CBS 118893]